METILTTENLSIGYTAKTTTVIADGIDLSLQKGKLISLIGANGIGKSTLLRTLAGISRPLSGKVILNEKNIGGYLPSTIAKQLSLVLTDKLPPSNLTVFELVALGRQPYTNWIGKLLPEDISAINTALTQTETTFLAQKKHYEISDGQLQKVMIARALAQDTPLIILDEPTTHLDMQHKASLLRLLKKLAESGKCVLFSTHDIDMAIEFSDEMILMFDRKTIQGKPADFIADGTFNRLFTGDITFDSEKVKFVFKPS
ncbi:MAG: ABC transporter ATP-binding protein [Flavobacterium sp.]|nr:MAG: ABC transporter ATP-binding protein [Flavobacterium sp.]